MLVKMMYALLSRYFSYILIILKVIEIKLEEMTCNFFCNPFTVSCKFLFLGKLCFGRLGFVRTLRVLSILRSSYYIYIYVWNLLTLSFYSAKYIYLAKVFTQKDIGELSNNF